jgi:hypothetical protein
MTPATTNALTGVPRVRIGRIPRSLPGDYSYFRYGRNDGKDEEGGR